MLTVSFKHYECQKRQCQNGPVFIPPLSNSLHLSIRHQQHPLSFSSSSKQKKNPSSSIGHTSMYSIYKLNLRLSDSHSGQLYVIMQHHMPLRAYIYCICLLVIEWLWCLSPALQSRDLLCLCAGSFGIFLRFTAPLTVFLSPVPTTKFKPPKKHQKLRESGASLCCLPPLCYSKHRVSAQIASY